MYRTKIALPLLVFSSLTSAGTMGTSPEQFMPTKSFFIGLGGGYNSVKLDQFLDPVQGTTDTFNGSTMVSSGAADGPANPFHNTQSTFSPLVQAGYFNHFSDPNLFWTDSNLLWGAKFSYKYVDTVATNSALIIPQSGVNTPVGGTPVPFTGRATINSMQTSVTHEMDLIPFIGHSFTKTNVYFGVGPSLFDTISAVNDVVGYADINGTKVNVSQTPVSFNSSKWMWGGSAQIGMTYYWDPTWFVDINYTYALTPKNSTDYFSPFTGLSADSGNTTQGTLAGTSSQFVTVQAIAVSINKAFSL